MSVEEGVPKPYPFSRNRLTQRRKEAKTQRFLSFSRDMRPKPSPSEVTKRRAVFLISKFSFRLCAFEPLRLCVFALRPVCIGTTENITDVSWVPRNDHRRLTSPLRRFTV